MNYFILQDTSVCGTYTMMKLRTVFSPGVSLFMDTRDEYLEESGPYLISINEMKFKERLTGIPMLNLRSCMVIGSREPLHLLASHFRKFLYRMKDGKEYFFRFYDSRVMKRLMTDGDTGFIKNLMGPVDFIMMEDLDPEYLLEFKILNETVYSRKVSAPDNFGKQESVVLKGE